MSSVIIALLSVFSTFHPEEVVLPPPAELHQSVRLYWNAIAESEAKAFREDWKKDRWADYVPSLGIAYTPSGSPRPGLSFSLGTLIASRKKKREAERMEIRIFEVYELKADEEIREVNTRVAEVQRLEAARYLADQLLAIEKLVFEIAQDEYDTAVLDPKSYLMAKRKWLIVQDQHARDLLEIERLKGDLLLFAHFE